MDPLKNKPISHNTIKSTGTHGTTGVTPTTAQQSPQTVKQALVEPPAPKAGKAEPYVGNTIAAQIGRIALLKGMDPESGHVAYTRSLSAKDADGKPVDRFDKVGIFFEAEAKLTLIDDADAKVVKDRVLEAGDSGKLSAVLPEGYKGKFSTWTVKWDRENSRSGADFHDVYGDDAKGSLAKAHAQCRERKIGDTPDGKFETKLPASPVQGSAVLGRLECAKSTGPTRRSKESILKEAIPVVDDMNKRGLKTPEARAAFMATLPVELQENPIILVAVEVPDFDPKTYTDRNKIDDIRHQLVIMDETGKDGFLLTLDFVHATRVETGKQGDFVEFEIERMDGATNKAGLAELIDLTNTIAKALDLVKSPAPKNARGMTVTE